MDIRLDSKICLRENVHVQDLDGEAVLLNLNDNHYYSLDKIGFRVFSLLTASKSIQETITLLLDEYEVELSQLQQDVIELVSQLVNAGLVEVTHE